METEEEKVSRLNAAHEVSKDFMQLKKKMKKYFCIFIIALLILSIIKIIFGTIEIYNPFGYPSSRNPSFETKVNGKRCGTSGHLYHHIPIIPFFYIPEICFPKSTFLKNGKQKNSPADNHFYFHPHIMYKTNDGRTYEKEKKTAFPVFDRSDAFQRDCTAHRLRRRKTGRHR